MKPALFLLFALMTACGPALAESAIDSVITQTVTFKKPNADATSVARRMYGRRFPSVLAERVWLTKPADGYDQMLVRLGRNADCAGSCHVAALYYDGKEWLEIWRRPGREVGLGPVGAAGLKPLFDGHHLWRWYGRNYIARVNDQDEATRTPTEAELKATMAALKKACSGHAEPLEPADVDARDIDLKDGNEVAMLVSSPYYCGNSLCPIVFLDGTRRLIGILYSLGPDMAVLPARDRNGRHLIELAVPGGIATWSVTGKGPRSVIRPMKITIAGDPR